MAAVREAPPSVLREAPAPSVLTVKQRLPVAAPWQTLVLLTLIGLAWLAWSWTLVAQHSTYHSNAYDLGFFDQIIWNTAHGRWFETTFVPYNFAGEHLEPVLLIFAAGYRFWPHVELLLLVQSAAVAWAALPLYLAARRLLASATAALLVATAYLISPSLQAAVLFDFHPELLGAAAIFAALALLTIARPGLSLIAAGSLLLLKEDAALAAVGFALLVWLRGYRRHAFALLAVSLLYLALALGLVMPAIRGGPGDLQERYGYLGTTPEELVLNAARHPALVWQHLSDPPQRGAVMRLVATQALLPLADPALVAALPDLAADLLATHPEQHALRLHYGALPTVLLLVAALLGIHRLRWASWSEPVWRRIGLDAPHGATLLATILLLAAGLGWIGNARLALQLDPARYSRTSHTAAVDHILHVVPAGAAVSAQSGLLPHLSQRPEIWEFPDGPPGILVVVDRKGWRSAQSSAAGYDRVLASLPIDGYCLLAEDDGVMLYGRSDRCGLP